MRNGLKFFELYWDSKQTSNKKMQGIPNHEIHMGTYNYGIDRDLSRIADAIIKLPQLFTALSPGAAA